MCFSLRYQECNTHEPYCHLWPAPLYKLFHIFSQKARFSKKRNIGHKMCYDFNYSFSTKIFSILKKNVRFMIRKSALVALLCALFFNSDLNENLIFLYTFYEKYSNVKFHENPSIGSQVVPRGLTDRQD